MFQEPQPEFCNLDPSDPFDMLMIGVALHENTPFTLKGGAKLDHALEHMLRAENDELFESHSVQGLPSHCNNEKNKTAETEDSGLTRIPVSSDGVIDSTVSSGLASKSDYAFLNRDSDFIDELKACACLSAETLIRELKLLALSGGYAKDTKDYIRHRARAAAISIALNLQERIPPALRPFWNVPAGTLPKDFTEEDTLMYNDIRLIDLHWLHCTGRVDSFRFNTTLLVDSFDFAFAASFVAERKKRDTKAEELGLAILETLPLRTLKSKKARERDRNIQVQLKKVASCVRETMLRPTCRLEASEAEMKDIATALLLSNGHIKNASTLHHQITGKKISEQQLRRRCKWLTENRVLAFSGKLEIERVAAE